MKKDIQMIAEIRQKLNYLIEVKGCRGNFICNYVGIRRDELCHFRKGRRDLNNSVLLKMEEFIDKYENGSIVANLY